jgi:hypothetical protein
VRKRGFSKLFIFAAMNWWKNPWWIALVVFVINMAIRLIHAGAYFPQGDEPFTVYFAQWPIGDIYKIVSTSNNPPTFEILLHLWMKVVGLDPFALRLLSVLLISLGASVIALIAFRLNGWKVCVVSSILFLLTNFQMDFAHTLRAYALLICSSAWSMYFFMSSSTDLSARNRIGWILTSFMTIASHYFGWFVIFTQWAALLMFKREKRFGRYTIINSGILLLMYLPLLVVMLKRYFATLDEGTFLTPVVNLKPLYEIGFYAMNSNEWLLLAVGGTLFAGLWWTIIHSSYQRVGKVVMMIFSVLAALPFMTSFSFVLNFPLTGWFNSQGVALFSMVVLCGLVILLLIKSNWRFESRVVLLWAFLPLVAIWFCSFKVPMFLDRYLSHILTALVLLIPAVLFAIPRKATVIGIPIVIALFGMSFNIAPTRILDSRPADVALKEMKREETLVILSPGYQDFMFAYFYSKDLFANAQMHREDTLGERIITESNFAVYKEGIRRALRRENIYVINDISMFPLSLDSLDDVVHYEFNTAVCYPENRIKDTLEAEFGTAQEVVSFPEGIYLYHYTRNRKSE